MGGGGVRSCVRVSVTVCGWVGGCVGVLIYN